MAVSLDLEKHLVFYGAYHSNSVNVAIHMIGVPLIFFSALLLATNTGALIPFPPWLTLPYLETNLGTIAALIWGSLYVLLEPVAGTVFGILCLAGTAFLNKIRMADPDPTNRMAIAVHIVAWIAQFIGHGVFEGRKPALLDNIVQAVFLAPLFVWLEFLFLLGYRPELQGRVAKKVQAELAKLKQAKSKEVERKAQ